MGETVPSTFERCCRLCAEVQDVTIMIFSDEAEAMLLQKKLHKYLLIEIGENDALPKNICIKCCSKLQTVCEFIDQAHKAQEMLLQLSLMPNINKTDNYEDVAINSGHENFESEGKATKMEVSVDPMIVLQNSEEEPTPQSLDNNLSVQDVTHLHDVDGENVTIKLIRNRELKSNDSEESDVDKPFSCKFCKRRFFSDIALKNHLWIHFTENTDNPSTDNTSLEADENKSDFLTHPKQHIITNGLCQLCGRMFRSEKTFRAHMIVHSTTTTSFACKVCGRSYKTWGSLRTHSITHSSERPYNCHFCKKSFKRKQDLKFHINQHTGARPYKCPFCDKSFASTGNCYSHRNRMHPGKYIESKMKRRTGQPKENQVKTQLTKVHGIYKYQCELCEHSFMKRENYVYHRYQHTGEKPFQCCYCPEKFVTKKGLLIHHDKEHPSQSRPLGLLTKNLLLM